MNRRGFLRGLGAIVAAPAVVRAESLMKIWVPPEKVIIGMDFGYEDITITLRKLRGKILADAVPIQVLGERMAFVREAIARQVLSDCNEIIYRTDPIKVPSSVRFRRYSPFIDTDAF